MGDVVQEQAAARDDVVKNQEAARASADERLGRRREREPDAGWTAQQGPKPDGPTDEIGSTVLPHQLPDPQVAIAAGIKPQAIPPTIINADDADEVARQYAEGEHPTGGENVTPIHPRSGEAYTPGRFDNDTP